MKKTLLSIVIPVYNEKETISSVLEEIEALNLQELNCEKEIIIVDDGSTDGTRDLLRPLENRYKIIFQSENQGKGAALERGFQEASGDYLIIQDADLEYSPKDIIGLLKIAFQKENLIVYGSRNLISSQKPSSLFYKWGGKMITGFFNFLFGQKLTDINTCYKLFPKRVLAEISLQEKRFAFCEEFTCQVIKKGYKIIEAPISYFCRDFGQGKKIRWWHGFRSLYVIFKNRFLL